MMHVIISEACDGFSLIVVDQGLTTRYWFSQEDDKKDLVKFFKEIGITSEYEEDY
jgi:hypothetical protein